MWHYNHTDTLYHGNYSPEYTAVDNGDSLAHYGVLGMKWGVRKQRESSGSRVGGRRQLSAKTKKTLRNIAIGAGVAGAGVGTALLLSKGIPRIKARNVAKGLSGSQLKAMSLSGNKVRAAAADKEIFRRAGKSLKVHNANVIKNSTNAELSRLSRNGMKGAERELANRGVQRNTIGSKINQANSKAFWNKDYKSYVANPSNAWIKNRQNAKTAIYNKGVTRGNAIRTGLVGAGIVGTGAGAAGATYYYNKKKKRK